MPDDLGERIDAWLDAVPEDDEPECEDEEWDGAEDR